ncbi:unnamed protein product [Scytosiphon promiscuus]
MRRGETVCRKLRVEGAAPTVRVSRASPPTSEVLAGEEIEEALELVNEGDPSVGIMEVWTRPCRTPGTSGSKPPASAMSLLFSLAAAAAASKSPSLHQANTAADSRQETTVALAGGDSGSAMSRSGVGVALAAPARVSCGLAGGVVIAGGAVKLALRLSAGQATEEDVVTEVLVKYSEKKGAPYHRQLRLPLRLAIRGGLRVCSLRVAQFLGGGLSFDADADATESLLLLELANDSPFPVFAWRHGSQQQQKRRRRRPRRPTSVASIDGDVEAGAGAEAGLAGGEVVEIPGDSRRCLSLRIPRLRVRPEGESPADDEVRSPLSLRPLFEWEKSLANHLLEELSLRWCTAREEALSAAAASVPPPGADTPGPPSEGGAAAAPEPEEQDGGSGWKPGRRGRVSIALDQIGDDGGCRLSPPVRRSRHPDAVPECLFGALLPPVRLSCLPFVPAAFAGSVGGVKAGVSMEAVSKGMSGPEGFPGVGMSEGGLVEVDGGQAGVDGAEGAWAAKTTVDSFLPVSLVVHNSSPWPVEVVVEVTSTSEGREGQGSKFWGDHDSDNEDEDGESRYIMWSGMPRRSLGKLAPGSSMCHGLLACFLTPGDVSIGFTCRVKVESPSAPYGSATSSANAAVGSAATPTAARTTAPHPDGDGESGGDGWHPVACHLPLKVSVFPNEEEASAGGEAHFKPEVYHVGPRTGGVPAGDVGDVSPDSSGSA